MLLCLLPFKKGDSASLILLLRPKLSTMVYTISRPYLSAFHLRKYFVGSQLARFRSHWVHLKDNSTPSALSPSPFYLCSLNVFFKRLVTRISDVASFHFTSKTVLS